MVIYDSTQVLILIDYFYCVSTNSDRLDIYTSHHPVACVVDTKYLNELVRGIRFPAKHAGLKHYVGILSSNFQSFPPLHLSSCCFWPHLQCELLPFILDILS